MNRKFRKFSNDIHLWLGLLSGFVLFVVCFSGTIYTFHKEVNEFFNKEKYVVNASGRQLSADVLAAGLENGEFKVSHLLIPAGSERSWIFTLKTKTEAGGKTQGGGKRQQLLVNPYTAQTLGSTDSKTNDFFDVMMKLHRWLLIDQANGRIVVGISTIIFVLLLISGIILWIPRRWRYWKAAFTVMFSGKWKRINHDLHNTLGFYTFLLLMVMALTGLCWSFEWYRNGMSTVLGDKVFKQRNEKVQPSVYIPGSAQISFSQAIAIADKALPFHGNLSVAAPADSAGSYSISKTREGFFAVSMPDKVIIDSYSGEVLKIEKFAEKKFLHQVAAAIRPLHTGEIFGLFSKIIYFLVCLVATSLPVTGTIIWVNKLRKAPKKKKSV